MKKRRLGIFVALSTLIIYLFWPLSSQKWALSFDQNSIENKRALLSNLDAQDSTQYNKPNILIIMVDDLGMADLSLYGDGYPQTPNIDALGEEGTVFSNAYVTSPVCSPSRAAMLSGKYQQRFGFQYQMHERYLKNRMEYLGFKYIMDSKPWIPKWMTEVPDQEAMNNQGIPPGEILLPELLKTEGYQTAIIGKWHLGSTNEQSPCNMGFDYQYGFYASHSLYAYENTVGIHDQKIEDDFTDAHIWSGQRNGPYAMYKNCEEIKVTEFLTDRFADEAIYYLQNTGEDPFFLYLSFNAPHTPLQAPLKYMQKFEHIDDPIKQTYYAMIANLDDNIGKVLEALKQQYMEENTLVFFISDNGGAEYTFATKNGDYKGGKITNFEGGLKVPFIIKWPMKIKKGLYPSMVSSMDIFQTAVEVAGVDLPDNFSYDGTNLIPYINDEKPGNPHDFLYWQRGFSKAIRSNDWKLNINEDNGETLLFNVIEDPYEKNDVSSQYPQRVESMRNTHSLWSGTLPSPLWPSLVYYEFEDGQKTYYFDQ